MRAPLFARVNVLNVVVYYIFVYVDVDFGQVRLSKPNALMPINYDSEIDCTRNTNGEANVQTKERTNKINE